MRVATMATIFVLLGLLFSRFNVGQASDYFNQRKILKNPNRYFRESLRSGISPYDFFKLATKINTFFGFESVFKKATTHNPLVFRQGGSYAPQPFPTARPIPGPPYDIYTPDGVIPGCLNLLCPPPQGALWVDGICWCTQ